MLIYDEEEAPASRTMFYPSGEDLCNWLVDGGILEQLPVDYSQYELAIASAISEWEFDSGYSPFLAEDDDASYQYSARNASVELKGGFYSITSVTSGTDVLVAGEQYVALPIGSVPKTALELAWQSYETITVVGRRGYMLDCPSDVYLAILTKAAQFATVGVAKLSGNISRLQTGEVSVSYNGNSNQHQTWDSTYKTVLRKYRRPKVY